MTTTPSCAFQMRILLRTWPRAGIPGARYTVLLLGCPGRLIAKKSGVGRSGSPAEIGGRQCALNDFRSVAQPLSPAENNAGFPPSGRRLFEIVLTPWRLFRLFDSPRDLPHFATSPLYSPWPVIGSAVSRRRRFDLADFFCPADTRRDRALPSRAYSFSGSAFFLLQ